MPHTIKPKSNPAETEQKSSLCFKIEIAQTEGHSHWHELLMVRAHHVYSAKLTRGEEKRKEHSVKTAQHQKRAGKLAPWTALPGNLVIKSRS